MNDKSFEERIPGALATTGFLLEHEVTEVFRSAKWGVIGSRYYIDDVDGRARELDLIAYKVTSGKDIDVVTSVLISCKKDSENAWVIMSRDRPVQDPNLDWNPVHQWTSNELLSAYLESSDWSKEYVSGDKELFDGLFDMQRQAFAFQLVSIKSCRPNNDKPIFGSLTDLMKAQDHELSILPGRMKKNRIYSFNLAAMVDAPIYDVGYEKSPLMAKRINEFRHLARYIVSRKDSVARVNIYSKEQLDSVVEVYEKLAKYNQKYFNNKVKEAYAALVSSRAVQKVIEKRLSRYLRHEIYFALLRNKRKPVSSDMTISYDVKASEIVLELPLDEEEVGSIANDEKLNDKTREVLLTHARFNGSFRYTADIPF